MFYKELSTHVCIVVCIHVGKLPHRVNSDKNAKSQIGTQPRQGPAQLLACVK